MGLTQIYKLMKESGYDFSKPLSLGYVIDPKPYGLNGAQEMVQKQWDKIVTPRIGLDSTPSQSVKISKRCKHKRSFTQHVMAEEAGNGKGDNATFNPKSSVFNRLQSSTPHQRPSVFKKMGRDKTPKPFVF